MVRGEGGVRVSKSFCVWKMPRHAQHEILSQFYLDSLARESYLVSLCCWLLLWMLEKGYSVIQRKWEKTNNLWPHNRVDNEFFEGLNREFVMCAKAVLCLTIQFIICNSCSRCRALIIALVLLDWLVYDKCSIVENFNMFCCRDVDHLTIVCPCYACIARSSTMHYDIISFLVEINILGGNLLLLSSGWRSCRPQHRLSLVNCHACLARFCFSHWVPRHAVVEACEYDNVKIINEFLSHRRRLDLPWSLVSVRSIWSVPSGVTWILASMLESISFELSIHLMSGVGEPSTRHFKTANLPDSTARSCGFSTMLGFTVRL